ncbi:MAG: response regulator [Notoacmeibacter sp.]|nr:response regulator [Notoacmeibacter sp.]
MLTNARILYLDDDPGITRLVQKALSRFNAEVIAAENLDQALECLAGDRFDAIVLDHYLQGTTGLEILESFHNRAIDIPVVYVTGSSEARVAVEAMKAGASDYVIKSVGEDFMPLLKAALVQAVETDRLRKIRIEAEEEIRRGKARAEALLAEVNHRVGNSLALVASLIRLQSAGVASPEAKDALAETQSRITAIADMHRALYSSDDVSRVEMDKYLADLSSSIRASWIKPETGIDIEVKADRVILSADRAVSVGMIVTELVTNAVKYAFPNGSSGRIEVVLSHHGEDRARLCVADEGIGFHQGEKPKGTGLGSRIIKSMAVMLGSQVEYEAVERGTRAVLMIDLAKQ